jgi:hypothetical protein
LCKLDSSWTDIRYQKAFAKETTRETGVASFFPLTFQRYNNVF